MVDSDSDSNTQGLEDIDMLGDEDGNGENLGDVEDDEIEVEGETFEDDTAESLTGGGVSGCHFEEAYAVNFLEDISCINFKELNEEGIKSIIFLDVGVAFTFYNWYASYHGFAGRKSKVLRNKKGEITQQ